MSPLPLAFSRFTRSPCPAPGSADWWLNGARLTRRRVDLPWPGADDSLIYLGAMIRVVLTIRITRMFDRIVTAGSALGPDRTVTAACGNRQVVSTRQSRCRCAA